MQAGYAGIGRTGVLVAADIALRQLRAASSPGEAKNAVDCKAIVQELRRCADPFSLSAPVGHLQKQPHIGFAMVTTDMQNIGS